MELAAIDDLELAYEVVGDPGGEPWAITPGGRYAMDSPGVRELALELADRGRRVLLWDRPNVGSSGISFTGTSESAVQADALAGLLRRLDMTPAVVAGGSGGARVSLLTAVRNRDVARGAALWWMSGGVYGLVTVGAYYCADSIHAAWNGGMEAVVELDHWQQQLDRNPANRERFLALDPKEFIRTLERWLLAYCPCGDDLVPGLPRTEASSFDLPTLVFRSGESDMHHTRATSEELAETLPNALLVEPPWGDTEWIDRQAARAERGEGIFQNWPRLAPQLVEWSDTVLTP